MLDRIDKHERGVAIEIERVLDYRLTQENKDYLMSWLNADKIILPDATEVEKVMMYKLNDKWHVKEHIKMLIEHIDKGFCKYDEKFSDKYEYVPGNTLEHRLCNRFMLTTFVMNEIHMYLSRYERVIAEIDIRGIRLLESYFIELQILLYTHYKFTFYQITRCQGTYYFRDEVRDRHLPYYPVAFRLELELPFDTLAEICYLPSSKASDDEKKKILDVNYFIKKEQDTLYFSHDYEDGSIERLEHRQKVIRGRRPDYKLSKSKFSGIRPYFMGENYVAEETPYIYREAHMSRNIEAEADDDKEFEKGKVDEVRRDGKKEQKLLMSYSVPRRMAEFPFIHGPDDDGTQVEAYRALCRGQLGWMSSGGTMQYWSKKYTYKYYAENPPPGDLKFTELGKKLEEIGYSGYRYYTENPGDHINLFPFELYGLSNFHRTLIIDQESKDKFENLRLETKIKEWTTIIGSADAKQDVKDEAAKKLAKGQERQKEIAENRRDINDQKKTVNERSLVYYVFHTRYYPEHLWANAPSHLDKTVPSYASKYVMYYNFAVSKFSIEGKEAMHLEHYMIINVENALNINNLIEHTNIHGYVELHARVYQNNANNLMLMLREIYNSWGRHEGALFGGELYFDIKFTNPIYSRKRYHVVSSTGAHKFESEYPGMTAKSEHILMDTLAKLNKTLLQAAQKDPNAYDPSVVEAAANQQGFDKYYLDEVGVSVLFQYPIIVRIRKNDPRSLGGAINDEECLVEINDEEIQASIASQIDLDEYLSGKISNSQLSQKEIEIYHGYLNDHILFRSAIFQVQTNCNASERYVHGAFPDDKAHFDSLQILYGKFHCFKTRKAVRQNYNCWATCLEIAVGQQMERPTSILQSAGVEKKKNEKGIPIESFEKVALAYNQNLIVVDQNCVEYKTKKNWYKVLFNPALMRMLRVQFNMMFVLFENNHYSLIQVVCEIKTCNICGQHIRSYRGLQHQCNEKKLSFMARQEIQHKTKNIKRILATYDIETRVDPNNYIETWVEEVEDKLFSTEVDSNVKTKKVRHNAIVPVQLNVAVENRVDNLPEDVTRDGFTGVSCIAEFLTWLIKEKDENRIYHFRAHNGSRFDAYFLLGIIERDPLFFRYLDQYSKVLKNTQILRFEFAGHVFCDSLQFLQASLEKLCSDFNIPEEKRKKTEIKIPGRPEFKKPLDLITVHPEKSPMEYIEWLREDEQKLVFKEMKEYCYYDCVSLLYVMKDFESQLIGILKKMKFKSVSPNQIENLFVIWDSITLPALSLKIFKKYWMKNKSRELNQAEDSDLISMLNKSVIGGISHVQYPGKHVGDIVLIDVVSLYVSSMLQFKFPYHTKEEFRAYEAYDVLPENWHGWIDGIFYSKELLKYHGVWNVKNVVTGVDLKISTVPGTDSGGRRDWSATCIKDCVLLNLDLLNILNHNGSFEIVRGYIWTGCWEPFIPIMKPIVKVKMVEDKKKDNGNPYNTSLRNTAKLCGNTLFGKLTQRQEYHKFLRFASLDIIPNELLHSVDPNSIIQCNDAWYVKVLDDNSKSSFLYFGTFILGFARVMMQQWFDLVGRENIIASETDSAYISLAALGNLQNKELCDQRMNCDYLTPFVTSENSDVATNNVRDIFKIGKTPGNMNVEIGGKESISRCFFLRKKCYLIEQVRERESGFTKEFIKMRAKGIPGRNLTPDVYHKLYCKNKVRLGEKLAHPVKVIVHDINMMERSLYRNKFAATSLMSSIYRIKWDNPFAENINSPLDVCWNNTMITHYLAHKYISPDPRGYMYYDWNDYGQCTIIYNDSEDESN
jgi:hypothetical protein